MDKATIDYVTERATILSRSNASKKETQEAAQAWLDAVANTEDEAEIEVATTTFVDFLEGRPGTIDGVIAFAQGAAVEMFGKEAADQMLTQQLARKEQGEKWCNCEACTAAVEILTKFNRI